MAAIRTVAYVGHERLIGAAVEREFRAITSDRKAACIADRAGGRAETLRELTGVASRKTGRRPGIIRVPVKYAILSIICFLECTLPR